MVDSAPKRGLRSKQRQTKDNAFEFKPLASQCSTPLKRITANAGATTRSIAQVPSKEKTKHGITPMLSSKPAKKPRKVIKNQELPLTSDQPNFFIQSAYVTGPDVPVTLPTVADTSESPPAWANELPQTMET